MSMHQTGIPEPLSTSVSTLVLETIALAEGVTPIDLSGRLYDEIDPDALDALYRDGRSTVAVEFSYLDYRVSIDERGEVSVRKE